MFLISHSTLTILQIGGIAFIAIGGLILSKAGDIDTVLREHNPYSVPVGLIVVGSVIFIIAFFGCCGAVRESQCMTMTVSIIEKRMRRFGSRYNVFFSMPSSCSA